MPPDVLHPWAIYQQHLVLLGHGLPIWEASPDPDGEEIHIGSVIYPDGDSGGYKQLFNAMKREGEPGQSSTVPANYVPLSDKYDVKISGPKPSIKDHWVHSKTLVKRDVATEAGTSLAAQGIVGAGASLAFKCEHQSGAYLRLEPPALRTFILSRQHITRYIRDNLDDWMALANDQWGLGLSEQELYFVSGTTKTSKWVAGAFQGDSCRNVEGSVHCDIADLANARVSVSWAQATSTGVQHNYGPVPTRAGPSSLTLIGSEHELPVNQCIFINYYKIKRQLGWLIQLKASAGPHTLSKWKDAEDPVDILTDSAFGEEADIEQVPARQEVVVDPVDSLLDYILVNSHAEVAMASDHDIISLFQEVNTNLTSNRCNFNAHYRMRQVGLLRMADQALEDSDDIPGGSALSHSVMGVPPEDPNTLPDRRRGEEKAPHASQEHHWNHSSKTYIPNATPPPGRSVESLVSMVEGPSARGSQSAQNVRASEVFAAIKVGEVNEIDLGEVTQFSDGLIPLLHQAIERYPFIQDSEVVAVFKGAIALLLHRREHDNKILALVFLMCDMMHALTPLAHTPFQTNEQGGRFLEARLYSRLILIHTSIKSCAALCDKYYKQHPSFKRFMTRIWKGRFAQMAQTFMDNKSRVDSALLHAGVSVQPEEPPPYTEGNPDARKLRMVDEDMFSSPDRTQSPEQYPSYMTIES